MPGGIRIKEPRWSPEATKYCSQQDKFGPWIVLEKRPGSSFVAVEFGMLVGLPMANISSSSKTITSTRFPKPVAVGAASPPVKMPRGRQMEEV